MIKKISQMDSKLGMREGNFPVENGATGLFCKGNDFLDPVPSRGNFSISISYPG
jgi:hypothetical protein